MAIGGGSGEVEAANGDLSARTAGSTDSESKIDKTDKKDKEKKKKDRSLGDEAAAGEGTPKKTRKIERSSSAEDAPVAKDKADKKEKKDKKTAAAGATASADAADSDSKDRPTSPSSSSSSVPGPSSDKKDKKDKSVLSPIGSPDANSARKKGDKSSSKTSDDNGDKKDKKDKKDKIAKRESEGKLPKLVKDGKELSEIVETAGKKKKSAASPPAEISPRHKARTTPTLPTGAITAQVTTQNSGPKPLSRVESALKIPVLDLSNRRLAKLPEDIGACTYLTKLYLSRNALKNIDELASLPDLQVLAVANNSLTQFPIALSASSSKLKDLLLSDNLLTDIPGTILRFPNLVKLDLMGNKLSEIPQTVLSITSLTTLNLSWNQISEVPKGISALTLLTSLSLHHNKVKRIASGICQLSNLGTLELAHNALSTIPESIAELASLTILDVSYNQLKEWPAAFNPDSQLDSLTRLDLSHNLITGPITGDKLPELPLFPSLEELYLNNNAITELPNELWRNISTVAVLDLRNNQLTQLSEEIEILFSLSTLELGSNKLTALPAEIGKLANLQVLSFYRNLITAIPDITALEYLQYLNCGHNQIADVSFEGLIGLEEAFLSGNPIKLLPEDIGDHCPNLKLLFASDLLLKKVPSGLSNLGLLEQIDFSHNRISEIPTSLGDLESLRSMSFAHCKLETSKEREVLKTPGKGPWDCIEFWQNFGHLLEVDLSFNKLKYIPKGLETKLGTECEVNFIGNPLVPDEIKEHVFTSPQLGKRYQVGWADMLGRRPTMEDHFLWQGGLEGHSNVDLFAVFDGHAARDAAKFCSEHLPEIMKQHLHEGESGSSGGKTPKTLAKSDTLFTKVFNTLNAALEKHLSTVRDTSVKHCGTTAVVVLIVGDVMQIANVGDSRAVLNSGERCTVDHKPRSEVDRIRSHPGGFVTGDGSGRINEVLAVSRSLGDFYMAPWVTCQPNVYSKNLSKTEDKFLVLACDGIWDEIEDADAISIVEPLIAEGELFKASAKLRDIAYCAGSDDNISVMIIKLSSK